jgi:hypothetical protein
MIYFHVTTKFPTKNLFNDDSMARPSVQHAYIIFSTIGTIIKQMSYVKVTNLGPGDKKMCVHSSMD